MHSIVLESDIDFAGFRSAARKLMSSGIRPEHVNWQMPAASANLFADLPMTGVDSVASPTFTVPAAFMRLAQTVVLHRDNDRFALLYRLLWRLRETPSLLDVAMDRDVARARLMEKSIHRDIHKMHAFVRFRRVPGVEPQAFLAWFEPQHHILEAAAPFFVRRFTNTPWAIITPEARAVWDRTELTFGPGGHRSEVPAEDATEDLWRGYYASIFNPARLKVNSMRGHMPQKYWRNLPESPLIPDLIAQSRRRTQQMIEESVSQPARRHQLTAARATPVVTESPASLNEQIAACRACPLWQHATQAVSGEGPLSARIMLVGEQPGDQEDLQGRPFVGPAGQLLDRALTEAGLDRASLYVTNAVKHFRFEIRGKRRLHKTPGQREVMACHQWLEKEITQNQPALIIALGATAAHSLLGRSIPVLANRGRIIKGEGTDRPSLLITIHPSALLRMPESERPAALEQFVADLRGALPYRSGE